MTLTLTHCSIQHAVNIQHAPSQKNNKDNRETQNRDRWRERTVEAEIQMKKTRIKQINKRKIQNNGQISCVRQTTMSAKKPKHPEGWDTVRITNANFTNMFVSLRMNGYHYHTSISLQLCTVLNST